MSWQDGVAAQIAAQMQAQALARAARGESLGDIALEGPVVGGYMRHPEFAPTAPPRALSGPPVDEDDDGYAAQVRAFCVQLSGLLGHDPRRIAWAFAQMAHGGWKIEVRR